MNTKDSEFCIVLSYGEDSFIPVDLFHFKGASSKSNQKELVFFNKDETRKLLIPYDESNRDLLTLFTYSIINGNTIGDKFDDEFYTIIEEINRFVSKDLKAKPLDTYKTFRKITLDEASATIVSNDDSNKIMYGYNYSIIPFSKVSRKKTLVKYLDCDNTIDNKKEKTYEKIYLPTYENKAKEIPKEKPEIMKLGR